MFKFLKEKLKSVINKFSSKVDKEAEEVLIKEEKPIKKEVKKPKVVEKKKVSKPKTPKKEKIVEEAKEEIIDEPQEESIEEITDESEKEIKEEVVGEIPKEVKVSKPSTEGEEGLEKSEDSQKEKPVQEEKPKKKGFFKKLFGKKEKPEEVKELTEQIKKVKEEELVESVTEPVEEVAEEPEKKGFFKKVLETVTKKKISESKFDELFWDIEVVLLENNVAVEVIEKIKNDLKEKMVGVPLDRGDITKTIIDTLTNSIKSLFDVPQIDLLKAIKDKGEKPYIISFIGVNGSGKTTSIGKIANFVLKNNLTCVMAAADTFRAASQEQLGEHAKNLGVKMIHHDYGSDPAAVAFDAIKMAKQKKIDVVLIDTAGRLHSNINLMSELEKIHRVSKPDLTLFVGESITGNDCVEQAVKFNEKVKFDGMILTKADVDDKGGAAISVSYVTGKPIMFIGTGQTYDDLKPFSSKDVIEGLGL